MGELHYRLCKIADEYENDHIPTDVIFDLLAAAPTVYAVEVVRCKDCKHLGFKGLCDGVCNRKMVGFIHPDDFCSYGERRDNG